MKNYIQKTETITVTVATPVVGGQILKVGQILGVVHESKDAAQIAAGDDQAVLSLEGVYSLTKKTGDAPAQGALLFWDNTNKYLTVTATGNLLAGVAWASAAGADTLVQCGLNHARKANEA